MHTVSRFFYLKDYKVLLEFDNAEFKIVDLEEIVNQGGEVFSSLKDLEYFKTLSLDDPDYPSSICWPNGADICPDILYEMGRDIR